MRAGLVAHSIHVPDTWGGWRIHDSQATTGVTFGSSEHARKVEGMIEDAISSCEPLLAPRLRQTLTTQWSSEARAFRAFIRELGSRQQRPFVSRAAFLARHLVGGSAPAREYLTSRLPARSPTDWVGHRLREAGFAPLLVASDRKRLAEAAPVCTT
jgi:hypothetical protein